MRNMPEAITSFPRRSRSSPCAALRQPLHQTGAHAAGSSEQALDPYSESARRSSGMTIFVDVPRHGGLGAPMLTRGNRAEHSKASFWLRF